MVQSIVNRTFDGGYYCCNYAMYLPKHLDLLITFDGIFPILTSTYTNEIGKMIDNLIKLMKPYGIERKLHQRDEYSIDMDNCKFVLGRNVVPLRIHPGKYSLTIDLRLRVGKQVEGNPSVIHDDIKRINCRIFLHLLKIILTLRHCSNCTIRNT